MSHCALQVKSSLLCYQELTGNDEWVSWLKSVVCDLEDCVGDVWGEDSYFLKLP